MRSLVIGSVLLALAAGALWAARRHAPAASTAEAVRPVDGADELRPILAGARSPRDTHERTPARQHVDARSSERHETVEIVGSVATTAVAPSDITVEVLGGLPYREHRLAVCRLEHDASFRLPLEPGRRIRGGMVLCVHAPGYLPVGRDLNLAPGVKRLDIGVLRVEQAGLMLSGQIVGPTGVPLPAIEYHCVREPGQPHVVGWHPAEPWRTGEEGRFWYPAVPAGRYALHLVGRGGGHVVRGLEAGDEPHAIRLEVEPEPQSLEALVRVLCESSGGHDAVTECRVLGPDMNDWTLVDRAAGLWRLRARKVLPHVAWIQPMRGEHFDSSHGAAELRLTEPAPGTIHVLLRQSRTLHGRVLVEGAPVAVQVVLRCVLEPSGIARAWDGVERESRVEQYRQQTGPKGHFKFDELPPGRALLDLEGPYCLTGVEEAAHVPARLREPFVVTLGDPTEVLVEAERTAPTVLEVVPAPDPSLTASDAPHVHWIPSDSPTAEAQFAFELTPEHAGALWRITIEPAYGREPLDFLAWAPEGWAHFSRVLPGAALSATWTPWHRIEGRLLDSAGKPIAGIALLAGRVGDRQPPLLSRARAWTDNEGWFSFRVPSAGRWRISLGEPLLDLVLPPIEASTDAPSLVLSLESGAPTAATSLRK